MPRIKSRFARIDPSSEAWTIRISFFTSAILFKISKQSRRGTCNDGKGHAGEEETRQMIWDAIDMIMPLRGLLARSYLDLF